LDPPRTKVEMDMKVIVVRQPWAWLIVNGFKDIENRTWRTRYRGTLLIQASASRPPKGKLDEIRLFARKRGAELPERFKMGGIVGLAQLEDCVTSSPSKWFEGPIGWVLSKPKKLPFIPLKGQLGLFDPPRNITDLLRRRDVRDREGDGPADA
jgi:ASCH domain